jgi:RNA polymerase sigma-70 factor, ECF subfamily
MERSSPTPDDLLVRQCLSRSEEAWQEFYSRFVALIRNVIRRHADLEPSDVQDIVQSVFLALTTALQSYESGNSLPGLVCLVAERVLIDEFRRGKAAKRDAQTEAIDHHDGNDPGMVMVKSEMMPQDEQVEKAQLASDLEEALRALDPDCRRLITLRYYDERPFNEIARDLGVSENAVTVRTRRCLDKLRRAYSGIGQRGAKP